MLSEYELAVRASQFVYRLIALQKVGAYGGLERRVSTTRPIPQNSLDRIEKIILLKVRP